jgi:hypothetical protein
VGLFNLARYQQDLREAAGLPVVDEDVHDGVDLSPLPEPRPTVSVPPVTRGPSRWEVTDPQEAEWVDEPTPADPTAERLRGQMRAWIKRKAANPQDPTPADPDWFLDYPLNRHSEVIPFAEFNELAGEILSSPKFNFTEAQIEQWLIDRQQEVIQPRTREKKELADSEMRRRKYRKETGTDLPRGAQLVNDPAKGPLVSDFVSSFGNAFATDPRVNEILRVNPADRSGDDVDRMKLVTDSLYAAFADQDRVKGPESKQGVPVYNDLLFFTRNYGKRFLPYHARQELEAYPPVRDYVTMLFGNETQLVKVPPCEELPEGGRVSLNNLAAAFLDRKFGQPLRDRLRAMVLWASGKPDRQALAGKLDPRLVEQLTQQGDTPESVGASLLDHAVLTLKQRYARDRHFGDTKPRNRSNVLHFQALNDPAKGTGEAADALPGDRRLLNNDRLMREQEARELDERSRKLGPQLREMAQRIQEAGKDIAAYMRRAAERNLSPKDIQYGEPSEDWPEGKPSYLPADPDRLSSRREEMLAKAIRVRMYTQALASELFVLSRNTFAGRERMKQILRVIDKNSGDKKRKYTKMFKRPAKSISDDPKLMEHIRGLDPYGKLYDEFLPPPDLGEGIPGELSESDVREHLSTLISNRAFQKMLQDRVASLMAHKLQKAGETLAQAVAKAKDVMRQDFADWGPFFLLDETQQHYGVDAIRMLTDAIPIRAEYHTGKGPHGNKWTALYYVIRREPNKIPLYLGWSGEATRPKGGKVSTKEIAKRFKQLHELREVASRNLGLPTIRRRRRRAKEMLQKAESVRANLVMTKVASDDIAYMDAVVSGLREEVNRLTSEFFRLLRGTP